MAQMAEARAALEQYFWLPVVPARPGAARRGHPRRPRRARRYAHRCRQVHLLPGALARAPRPHPRGEPARLGSWATRSAPSRPRARARAISTQPSPCRSRTPCSSVRARAGIRSCTWPPERLADERFIGVCAGLGRARRARHPARGGGRGTLREPVGGQDFRPSYLEIARFIDALPSRPVVAAFNRPPPPSACVPTLSRCWASAVPRPW